MSIVQDTATDTGTPDLNAHTPEVGGVPTKHPNFTGGSLTVDGTSGTIRKNGTSQACYYYAADPASADYQFDLDFVCKTRISGDIPGFYVRLSTANHTGLRLLWNAASNQWQLARVITSTATTIGTFNQTLSAGNTYHVHGEVEGTTVSVWIGTLDPESDPPTITGSTGAVTTAGKAGAANIGSVTHTTTTGVHLDSILVDELATPAPPANTVLPAITGTPQVSQVLTCSEGTWTNSPTDFAYQWTKDTVDISGANVNTYSVVSGDVSSDIACKVTASNGDGSTVATAVAVTIEAPVVPEGWRTGTLYRYSDGGWG